MLPGNCTNGVLPGASANLGLENVYMSGSDRSNSEGAKSRCSPRIPGSSDIQSAPSSPIGHTAEMAFLDPPPYAKEPTLSASLPPIMQRINSMLGGTLDMSSIANASQNNIYNAAAGPGTDAVNCLTELLSQRVREAEHTNASDVSRNLNSLGTSAIDAGMTTPDNKSFTGGRAIRGGSVGSTPSPPKKPPQYSSTPVKPMQWPQYSVNDQLLALMASKAPKAADSGSTKSSTSYVTPAVPQAYDAYMAQSLSIWDPFMTLSNASSNSVIPAAVAGDAQTPKDPRSCSPIEYDGSALSTGSSGSSFLSMSYLRDLMATLNLTNPTTGSATLQQPCSGTAGYVATASPILAATPIGSATFDDSAIYGSGYRPCTNAWNNLFATNVADPFSIEKAARLYRNAAAVCDATCTWSGQLPPRNYKNPVYSCKVFVGGVPWDITEATLIQAFKQFGPVHVEWPGREARYARAGIKPSAKGKGYVYIIFESEKSVKALLQNCNRDFSNTGDWYFKLTTRRLRTKEIRQVQIIPWIISDSTYVRCNNQRMDPHKTIFVGALHGMITSEVLAVVMNDLFGGVVYAGVDTDKYKYPIGSGRVTFNNQKSYFKAVTAAFVEIKTPKFNKKVQIDPYLEDSVCSMCSNAPGPYFCREMMCFRYFCKICWQGQHGTLEAMRYHKPLMRNTRATTPTATPLATNRRIDFVPALTHPPFHQQQPQLQHSHQALQLPGAAGPIGFALAATSAPPPTMIAPPNHCDNRWSTGSPCPGTAGYYPVSSAPSATGSNLSLHQASVLSAPSSLAAGPSPNTTGGASNASLTTSANANHSYNLYNTSFFSSFQG